MFYNTLGILSCKIQIDDKQYVGSMQIVILGFAQHSNIPEMLSIPFG